MDVQHRTSFDIQNDVSPGNSVPQSKSRRINLNSPPNRPQHGWNDFAIRTPVLPLSAPIKPLSDVIRISPLDIVGTGLPKLPDPSKIVSGSQPSDLSVINQKAMFPNIENVYSNQSNVVSPNSVSEFNNSISQSSTIRRVDGEGFTDNFYDDSYDKSYIDTLSIIVSK